MNGPDDSDRGWIERPGNPGKLYRLLLAVCGLLLVLDLLDLFGLLFKHGRHGLEDWLGFYSLYGFAAYAFIVGAGWVWRAVVGRGPGYYDGDSSGENGGTEEPTSGEGSSSGENGATGSGEASASGGDSPGNADPAGEDGDSR